MSAQNNNGHRSRLSRRISISKPIRGSHVNKVIAVVSGKGGVGKSSLQR